MKNKETVETGSKEAKEQEVEQQKHIEAGKAEKQESRAGKAEKQKSRKAEKQRKHRTRNPPQKIKTCRGKKNRYKK